MSVERNPVFKQFMRSIEYYLQNPLDAGEIREDLDAVKELIHVLEQRHQLAQKESQ